MNLLSLTTIFAFAASILNPFVTGLLHKTNITSISQKTICNEDLRLSQAEQKLNNKTAVNLLKQNCEWLMDNFSDNFDGKQDLIFLAAGAGCASCRAQELYVLSGDKIIFQKSLDDPQIKTVTVNGLNALAIKQPIRKDNEPLSDPSQWFEDTYLWNDTTTAFDKFDETIGFYAVATPTPLLSTQTPLVTTPTQNPIIQDSIKQIDNQITTLNNNVQKALSILDNIGPCMTVACSISEQNTYSEISSIKLQIQQLQAEKTQLQLQEQK